MQHFPRNGRPHLENGDTRPKHSSDEGEIDTNEKTIGKSNAKKKHIASKSKRYNDHTDDRRGTGNDQSVNENKHEKNKILIKNSNLGREWGNDKDKDVNNNYNKDKKPPFNGKRMSNENLLNEDKTSSDEEKIGFIEIKNQNNAKRHKNYKNRLNDKQQKINDKNVTVDKNFSRNKLHNDQGLSIVNVHNSKNQNNFDKQNNKNKFSKDKITNLREKGQIKNLNNLQVKTTKGQPSANNESKWPLHHHRSKLRTHEDQHELR